MGHSHFEDIEVVRAVNSTDPIGFNLVTASGTSGDDMNPSFTVIDFDEEFMVPVNTHTYDLNLTEANALPADGKPVRHELHDMVEEYSLEDMSPSSLHPQIVEKMAAFSPKLSKKWLPRHLRFIQ